MTYSIKIPKTIQDKDGKYRESFSKMKEFFNKKDNDGLLRVFKVNQMIETKTSDSDFNHFIVEPYGIPRYLLEKLKRQWEHIKKDWDGKRDIEVSNGIKTWKIKKIVQ